MLFCLLIHLLYVYKKKIVNNGLDGHCVVCVLLGLRLFELCKCILEVHTENLSSTTYKLWST